MFKILDFLFVFSDFYSFNFFKKVKNSLFLATFWQFLHFVSIFDECSKKIILLYKSVKTGTVNLLQNIQSKTLNH